MLGLYLHVPFCQALCSYCNFNRGLFDAGVATQYVAALEREITSAAAGTPADTIFFGGGTPSILPPADIGRLIAACRRAFDLAPDAEITLETNPETVTVERMRAWRLAGVNRISLGAQSFHEAELRRLERVHSVARIGEAVRCARDAGIGNVSLDLMFWLPGQTPDTWRASVEEAIGLEPDHLSLYLLELYPNAPLREAMARAGGSTPDPVAWVQVADDLAADMYLDAFDRLDRAGFVQYEISNAARPGCQSRHNLKYWTMGDWRGFGCGAHSTVQGERWQNVAGTAEYIGRITQGDSVAIGHQRLNGPDLLAEALFTGLRLSRGIDCGAFRQRFGRDPWETYGEALGPAAEAGLLWRGPDGFGLTRAGMLISNEIGQLFV